MRFCVQPLRMKSLFSSSPRGLLQLSSIGLQSQGLWMAHLPIARTLTWGLRTLNSSGRPFAIRLFSSLWVAHAEYYGIWLLSQLCSSYRSRCGPFPMPLDWSPPGSSVHGIFQERILEQVAIPFYRGSSRPRDQTRVSCIGSRFFTVWATREEALTSLVIENLCG